MAGSSSAGSEQARFDAIVSDLGKERSCSEGVLAGRLQFAHRGVPEELSLKAAPLVATGPVSSECTDARALMQQPSESHRAR
eukprot:3602388-Alexandrium_andersonii.AAC.1